MSTMKDLSRLLAMRSRVSQKSADAFVNEMFDMLKDALNTEGMVKIKGLGTFRMQQVRERESIDVNTGKRVIIASHARVTFTPDSTMKESVNKPFAHFETVPLNEGVKFLDTPEENVDEIDDANANDVSIEDVPSAEKPTPFEVLGIQTDAPIDDQANASDATHSHIATASPIEVVPVDAEKPQETQDTSNTVTINIPIEPSIERISSVVEVPVTSSVIADSAVPSVAEVPVKASVEEHVAEEPVKIDNSDIIEETQVEVTLDSSSNAKGEGGMSCNEPEEDASDEETTSSCTWGKILAFAVAFALFFVAGVIVGRMTVPLPEPKVQQPKAVVKPVAPVDTIKKDTLYVDSAKIKSETIVDTPKPLAESEKKDVHQEKEDKPAMPSYDSDVRVRTGAYVITGIEGKYVVKSGQTFASIARVTLGSGMECYIEAVNPGVKELKAGQTINMPKIVHKKALKKKK